MTDTEWKEVAETEYGGLPDLVRTALGDGIANTERRLRADVSYFHRRGVLVGVAVAYAVALVAGTLFTVEMGVLLVDLPGWVRLGGRLPRTVPVGTLTTLPLPGAFAAGWVAGIDPVRGAVTGYVAHVVAVVLPTAVLFLGLGLWGAVATVGTGGEPADAVALGALGVLFTVLAVVAAAGFALGGLAAGAAGSLARRGAERARA